MTAAGIALVNSIGNLGGFVGPYVVGLMKDATGSTDAGLLVLAAVLAFGIYWNNSDDQFYVQLAVAFGALGARLRGKAVVLGMIALLVASFVLTYSVFSRYLFRAGTDWQDEVAVFCIVGAVFLAAGVCLSLIAQIAEQIDYLRFMPPRTPENSRRWWTAVVLAGPGWVLFGAAKQIVGLFLALGGAAYAASPTSAADQYGTKVKGVQLFGDGLIRAQFAELT